MATDQLTASERAAVLERFEAERVPCEIWTRVMGYHRPVSAFNPGKAQEHRDRKHFVEAWP